MPKQLTKTLGDFNVSTDILRQGFVSLAGNKPELNDLGIIFEVGLTDLSLFPNIKLSDSATYMDYLEKWINPPVPPRPVPAHGFFRPHPTGRSAPQGEPISPPVLLPVGRAFPLRFAPLPAADAEWLVHSQQS